MTKITYLCIAFVLIFCTASEASNNNNIGINNEQSSQTSTIQRVRIDIVTPNGYMRHLLLGFTTNNIATDGFDYGYDGPNADNLPDDCNWMIDENRYIIQGVGAFDKAKKYPLGLFLTNSGSIEISLNSLENFDDPIDLFIYDALLNTYTQINDSNFTVDMISGEYTDRFYIAFEDSNAVLENASLSTSDNDLRKTIVRYLSHSKEIYINTNNGQNTIKQIRVYSILGKELFSLDNLNVDKIKLPIQHLNTNYGIISIETNQGNLSKKVIFN